ncbi:hypothetical protein [Fluviicola taffensis]|nr:hypothetical protein [Fluviicola taffensis]
MRFWLLFLVVVFSFNGNSQEIKKKYLGIYSGEIPSYALEIGLEVFQVESTPIQLELKPAGIFIERLNSIEKTGTYKVLREDKTGIYLEGQFDGQFIPESFILYKAEKRLERKGIYPQPEVFLKKI